jgi:Mor family transcriptional regulator
MSYIKAVNILPQGLLALIQEYVDGEYLYIPRKECNKKDWGDNTSTKEELQARNALIYQEYQQSTCIKVLAQKYFLSEKSLQRIITEMKKR